MVGFTGVGNFLLYWLHLGLHVLWQAYLGQMLAYLLPTVEVATIFGALIETIFLLFNGFNPPASSIPQGYKWLYHITPQEYSLAIVSSIVFGDCPSDGDGSEIGCTVMTGTPPTLAQGLTVKEYVESVFLMKHSELWQNFGIVIGFIVLYRALGLFALRFVNHQKNIWRQQEALRWVQQEGNGVPTRSIKHFGSKDWKLDGGSVRRWWRDREKLMAADPTSRRLAGGGRRPLSGAMEEALYDEIVAKRLKKEKETLAWIGHMARRGDIGIYKTFKDLLYMEINAWKESDKVEYTRFENPRMPSVRVVCGWIKKAWRDTDSSTVINCVAAAGFADNCMDWHVARHDVYGEKFREKWEASREVEQDEVDFNLDDLHDALDGSTTEVDCNRE
ncbi:hypothetical protein BBJ28_00023034 [Nothophytophthora sp. Chile5]|nr:hypothetical protein BBJ28_00023034 [Nothophytophthora sp. Chile5]